MAVKYFDKEKNEWVVFPGISGAPGKDAYQLALENGYTGTTDDFYSSLASMPDAVNSLKNKADKSELVKYVLKDDLPFIPQKVSDLKDASLYATKDYVDGEIEDRLSNADFELDDYVKKTYFNDSINGLASVYTTLQKNDQTKTELKEYVDNKVDNKFDPINSANSAKEDAISHANNVANNAETNAKEYADQIARQTLSEAKQYADGLAFDPSSIDMSNYYNKAEAETNFISPTELQEELKPYIKFVSEDGEINGSLSGYVSYNDFDTYKTSISNRFSGIDSDIAEIHDMFKTIKYADYVGAPGYRITEYNQSLIITLDKELYKDSPFGIVVIPISDVTPMLPQVSFSIPGGNSISICEDDPIMISTYTYYRMYMIMYIGESFFVNGSTFKSLNITN